MTRADSSWRQAAACRGKPTAWWFPDPGPAGAEALSAARAVCDACPVRADCLAEALATKEQMGIWGGLTASERRRITRGDAA